GESQEGAFSSYFCNGR
ncbi:hypothetical protein AVEN_18422-2-1, partial [Araneus ventricosus]